MQSEKLGDISIIRERLEFIRREEEQSFRAMARRKCGRPCSEDKAIDETFKTILEQPIGDVWELLAEKDFAKLDIWLTDLFAECLGLRLSNYPIVHGRLEKIYHERRLNLQAKARRRGVRRGDEDEAIDDAYMALLNLAPRGNILSLLKQSEITPEYLAQAENLAKLDGALTALFITYLKFKCRDLIEKYPRDHLPEQELTTQPVTMPFPQQDARLTLERLDHLVDQMYVRGELKKLEWEYWRWRRANPFGKVEDFAHSLDPPRQVGGWIKKTERTLFEKIASKVANWPPRPEQDPGGGKKGSGRKLSAGRSQQERRWV